ncbi:hypothetical protein [Nocardia mangyaensis]|uniref:hypothetical protein n=1 Tax=Nocardia mangyaensis TaxID=2213200 RepID=UPI002676C0BF|nr:hypothetical protein [Nocardia mangyaensis]MDO3651157.1 hypothetical protein [Nocardia mangyaensis]
MHQRSFEDRYQSYVELLRDYTPNMTELGAIERQLGRLNHDVVHAVLDPDRRLALLELRNETMTMFGAAMHRARIDDARDAARAAASGRATPEERRRHAARQKASGAPAPHTTMGVPTPPRRPRDRGIER